MKFKMKNRKLKIKKYLKELFEKSIWKTYFEMAELICEREHQIDIDGEFKNTIMSQNRELKIKILDLKFRIKIHLFGMYKEFGKYL